MNYIKTKRYKLYHGDCLDVLANIKKAHLILCDLPYGTTACKWDKIIDIAKLWDYYKNIISDRNAIVLFGQEPFSSYLRMSNIEMYRYDWIWQKQRPSNFQLMKYQCGRITENIMVFSKAKACYVSNGNNMIYNAQVVKRDSIRKGKTNTIYGKENILHNYNGSEDNPDKIYDVRQPINILKFNTVEKNKLHPTQKPVELLEYLINTYSNENDIVLDNCMGSGSTGIACLNTGRRFIGIEKEAKYFDIAVDRIQGHKSIRNLFD